MSGRSILHVDMDAFFASVEQLDQPQFKGKPVLVGHDGPRGVVAAASYEARVFGCHSAQPMVVAKRNCPHAIILPTRFLRYQELSRQVRDLMHEVTPAVEPLSIDEAFLDVTGSDRLLGPAPDIARNLKKRIHSSTGLTASIGVAPNKFLAKLASDLEKPDGLTIIDAENIDRVLPPLPVGRIWGIGPKTVERLHGMNVRTIADLRRQTREWFERWFGSDADRIRDLSFGRDNRPVRTDDQPKQVSHEQTFQRDVPNPTEIRDVLLGQVEQVARRLRQQELKAFSVTVKIRFGDFQTITRRCTLDEPTDVTETLWHAARDLFDTWAAETFHPVRLIGMSAGNFNSGAEQLSLFVDPHREKNQQLDRTLDGISARFGKNAIRRGKGK